MRAGPPRFWAACIALLLALPPASVRGAEAYLDELRAQARRQELWRDPHWLLLLRYRRTWWGAMRSETPTPEFFLSPRGRADARAELEAALAAFQEPDPADPREQHPQCRFPARYAWLKERLRFDPDRLPERPCPRFEKFRRGLTPESLTLIFASAYLNSPASMYGHTFLRFDHSGRAENQRLLDYTLNYAAYAVDDHPLLYAARGLMGGYEGRYSILPYYVKVQEYSNLEARDIWEYRLSLPPEALERLMKHVWEQGNITFPYYFFNRNCSYQLLPLLDAAQPGLGVAPPWRAWIIPADTIRWIENSAAKSSTATYRPSLLTSLRARRSRLSRREAALAAALAEGPLEAGLRSAEALTPERGALVLDAALDFLLYKAGPRPDPGADVEDREQALLSRRRSLKPVPLPVGRPAWARPPHEGHPTARVGLGFGAARRSTFQEFSLRVALHDLLDPSAAYEPGSQLEMGHLRLRYDDDARRVYLQSLTIVDILSLTPWDTWIRQQSWKVRTGLRAADELGVSPWHAAYYELRVGRGLAAESALWRRELWYVFAEGDAGVGEVFRDWYRVGGGGSLGVAAELAAFWRARFEGFYLAYPLGDDRDNYGLRLIQNLDFSRRLTARAALELRGLRREASMTFFWYF